MSAHTPRPWQIVERETFADSSVYPRHIVGGPDQLQVCYLESQYAATNSTPVTARRDADGRLIAAAPELLSALIALLSEAEAFATAIRPYANSEAIAAARAAIAKATGAA